MFKKRKIELIIINLFIIIIKMSTFVESENNNKTFIIYLLDESGSMYATKDDTIGTRDKCIEEMKNMKVDGEENEPSFIYYTFSDNLSNELKFENISDIDITKLSYNPGGGTALLDSMGKIMNKYKNKSNVIIFIFTDGYENMSREYSYSTIQKMTKDCKKEKKWQFKFIGANIDAFNVGNSLGLDNSDVTQSLHRTPLHPTMTRGISQTLLAARETSVNNRRTRSLPDNIFVNANGVGFTDDTIRRPPHNVNQTLNRPTLIRQQAVSPERVLEPEELADLV